MCLARALPPHLGATSPACTVAPQSSPAGQAELCRYHKCVPSVHSACIALCGCTWAQRGCCCLQAAGSLPIWPSAPSSRIREAVGAGREEHANPMQKTDSHQSLAPPSWHCISFSTLLAFPFMPLPESYRLPISHRLARLGPVCMLPNCYCRSQTISTQTGSGCKSGRHNQRTWD